MRYVLVFLMLGLWGNLSASSSLQVVDTNRVVSDHILFEAKHYTIDPQTKAITVEVALTSLKSASRELKLNTFATRLLDKAGEAHLYTSLQLGRVLVRPADQQNYLHYLLQRDTPVTLTITIGGLPEGGVTVIQKLEIVFEDSTDEGRFLTVNLGQIPLKLTKASGNN